MWPSPTMPRDSSASGGSGVIQSPIWYDAMRRAGPGDLVEDPGLPPEVEGVDDDPHLLDRELLGDVERLGERGHRRPGRRRRSGASARSRAARHGRRPRVRAAATASVAAGAGRGQVAVAVRQTAGHQHQSGRTEGRGLVESAEVVLVRLLAGRLVGCGEEPAAAERRDPQAGVPDPCATAFASPASATGSRHTPIDGTAAGHAAVDRLAQSTSAAVVPLVQGQPREPRVARERRGDAFGKAGRHVVHRATPLTSARPSSGTPPARGRAADRRRWRARRAGPGAARSGPTAGRRPW